MMKSILNLISEASELEQIVQIVNQSVSEIFAAANQRLFLFDDMTEEMRNKSFADGRSPLDNPIFKKLYDEHAPVHEAIVLTSAEWRALCPRADHRHVLAGPIVKSGELAGVLAVTRDDTTKQFDQQNLAQMSALCLHISSSLTRIEQGQSTSRVITISVTPRQQELIRLVARGMKNADIAQELHISEHSVKQALKRLYRKHDVSSRTQLLAKAYAPQISGA